MQRKLRDDNNKDAGNLKTKLNKIGSANVSPAIGNGRRSKTASPLCSSSVQLDCQRSATSTPERQSSSTGDRRALSLTPESSSTQRELKKLEDYWTRNNPVKEDSPRLRSTRKVIFNIKDCFGERRSPRTPQREVKSDQTVSTNLHKCLPESPIPDIKLTDQIASQKAASCSNEITETDVSINEKKRQSNNPSASAGIQESFQSYEENDSVSKYMYHDQPESKSNENRKPCQEDEEPNTNSDETQDVTDVDSSDSDDDDYVPPRKKLRSEVSQDELWEGIPLTVSFKRLAPITKLPYVQTTDDSSLKTDFVEYDSKGEKESDEVQQDKGVSYLTKYVNDRGTNNTYVSCTDQEAPKSGIKRKRSMRLKEKNTGNSIKSNNTNVLSGENSPVVHAVRENAYTDSENSVPKPQSTDGNKDSKTDMDETIVYANKEEVEHDNVEAANDCPGGTLLALTLSQILSDDNKCNDLNVSSGKIDESEDEEKTDADAGNKKSPITIPTCVTSSFSKTINDIFEVISGPDDVSKEESHEKGPINNGCVEENCPRVMTRRSRRLSGIETDVVNENKARHECDKDIDAIPELADSINTSKTEIPETEQTIESSSKTTGISLSSSKHTLFTKKQNKSLKTVPPLRIKLKQSAIKNKKDKCLSNSNQMSERKNIDKVRRADRGEEEAVTTNKERSDSQESHPCSSGKGQITPLKNKKKKTKQRKWSPPLTTIELRLNSERRLSAAGSLLSNPMLNKHACVLWSSENRRHMHLSIPHATLSELDAKLSRKWDNLSEKEKLRYFQRARDAIKDENRHSSRRVPDSTNHLQSDSNPTKQYEDDCTVENFQKISPALQMSEIKKWLNFYNEVSPPTFSMIIRTFKEAIVEENKNKVDKEKVREKAKVKSKKNKQKKKDERLANIDSNANYRKMLFEKIQEQKENVKDVLTLRRKEQAKSVLESFSNLVKRMVCGDVFHFTGDVRSDRLTETLSELRALEKENKLAVTGNVARDDKDFENILGSLRSWNSPDGKSLVCALDDLDTDVVHVENVCKEILQFPSLSPKSIANNLPDLKVPANSEVEVNFFSPLKMERCNRTFSRTSPVSVLTDMVADDIMKQQPQIGFRNAISLLSNKIVPSPTILPPNGTNIKISSANRNNNSNVVFTKLLNSRSSVVSTKVNLLN